MGEIEGIGGVELGSVVDLKTCSRFRAYGVAILRLALAVKNTTLFPSHPIPSPFPSASLPPPLWRCGGRP